MLASARDFISASVSGVDSVGASSAAVCTPAVDAGAAGALDLESVATALCGSPPPDDFAGLASAGFGFDAACSAAATGLAGITMPSLVSVSGSMRAARLCGFDRVSRGVDGAGPGAGAGAGATATAGGGGVGAAACLRTMT